MDTLTLPLRRFTIFVLFALPLLAQAALPGSSSVPGGVAVLQLGSVVDISDKPQVWFEERPVLVTADAGQWNAVVGLGLNVKPGTHLLRVKIGEKTKSQEFVVNSKDYPKQYVTLKDNSKIELSPKDLARAEREIAAITRLKRHWRVTQETDLAFILPADGELGGRFGARRYFNNLPRAPHAGLDLAVKRGTPIKTSAQGVVLAVEDYFFNGKSVFVDHGNGLITLYCHLDRIDVKPGQNVLKAQHLGLSGMSGRASGPHLHWSVVLNGVMVDPELFIQSRQP